MLFVLCVCLKSVLVFVMTMMKSFAAVKLRPKEENFLGAAASSSFLSSSHQSIFSTRFIVANENKNKRDFDGERGREREREQQQKAFGGRAKTTTSSFFSEKK